ncbi:unnamed protein product [Pleuronectes platessa]|uniref:Uncharacterized protein n=1 Tax=Pleuronectes platessa TaxID=8262 RepID=A0A9N7ULN3_PLEPL|nr:unnamed protein product [Pleuronectes platessa]
MDRALQQRQTSTAETRPPRPKAAMKETAETSYGIQYVRPSMRSRSIWPGRPLGVSGGHMGTGANPNSRWIRSTLDESPVYQRVRTHRQTNTITLSPPLQPLLMIPPVSWTGRAEGPTASVAGVMR